MSTNPNQATALLGLYAQTSIHAGTGQTTGVVDLPIQREGHNGWPCIFGSGMKGSLRNDAEEKGFDAASVAVVYGPGPDARNKAAEHAGALAVTDARLLLLPVRSLTSHFKWVTCPAILDRLKRDADRLGLATQFQFQIPQTENPDSAQVVEGNDTLYLEEYRFSVQQGGLDVNIVRAIVPLMGRMDAEEVLTHQLVVVHNDMFGHLAQNATPVFARVSLNSGSKTVKEGPWYEETLPPETLMYSALVANRARNEDVEMGAQVVLDAVRDQFKGRSWLQVGGNETVGMGWFALNWLSEGD